MRRVFVYIDGQNAFHGLTRLGLSARSFNFRAYAESLCKGNPEKHIPDKRLDRIKYFGARYPREVNEDKHNRDDAYFKALAAHQDISVIEGRFRVEKVGKILIPQEKGVDVRLATDLIVDAFHSSFDDAYIISTDTDLLPAVDEVRRIFKGEKRIFACVFQRLPQFVSSCDYVMKIHKDVASQFIDHKKFPASVDAIAALKGKFAPVT